MPTVRPRAMATVTARTPTSSPPPFRLIITDKKHHGIKSEFDPNKHLIVRPGVETIKMADIGYSSVGISPVAVSQPFQLFSTEAVEQMRAEILKPEVMEHCKYQSNLAACQLRGYAPKFAPFTYDAWKSPETLKAISEIAGLDLVPAIDFDIGHINFSVKSEKTAQEELAAISKEQRFFADDEGIAGCPWEDDKPVVGWHTDSYPFVCVLMLSDCTNMVGGETALRTGTGGVLKVRGPQQGCAVVMQGRYIAHQALRALGAQERITMVTSFRARSPHLPDDTVLETIRPISNLRDVYYEFGEYRLDIMEERIRAQLARLRERRRAGKPMETLAFKKFLKEQIAFLEHTDHEMIEEELVEVGFIKEKRYPEPETSPTAEQSISATKRPRVE